jgi:hypothetical protein
VIVVPCMHSAKAVVQGDVLHARLTWPCVRTWPTQDVDLHMRSAMAAVQGDVLHARFTWPCVRTWPTQDVDLHMNEEENAFSVVCCCMVYMDIWYVSCMQINMVYALSCSILARFSLYRYQRWCLHRQTLPSPFSLPPPAQIGQ